ncbi:cell division septal protein [Burkholderiales bacterium JOSHI_001]|nr:cell division septal protein [Burkholderiales bacterium JOSHI_001]
MATATFPANLPLDVRLTRGAANVVLAVAALALLVAAVLWLARLPMFGIRAVRLDGDLARNSVSTVRANALPRLAGGFFTLDLQRARAAFESVPWVRRAVVQRRWPNRLAVRLEEHQPAALWTSTDGSDKLVNTHGEVFDANLGDVEDDGLPTFSGPEGSSARMLAMYQRLAPLLQRMDDAVIDELDLSARGSWRVELDSGATLELGRGDEAEVLARTERFVRTVAQVTGRYQRPLQYADLRHTDGYAVKLTGISTAPAEAGAKNP